MDLPYNNGQTLYLDSVMRLPEYDKMPLDKYGMELQSVTENKRLHSLLWFLLDTLVRCMPFTDALLQHSLWIFVQNDAELSYRNTCVLSFVPRIGTDMASLIRDRDNYIHCIVADNISML